MALRRPLAPAFCLFHKIITSEAASSVGGLCHFKPSVVPLAVEHVVIIIGPRAAWAMFECAFEGEHVPRSKRGFVVNPRSYRRRK